MTGDEHLTLGVFQHIKKTVVRIVIVQGNIGATTLLNTKSSHDELLLVAQHDADKVVFLNSHFQKATGQRSSDGVKFFVCVTAFFVNDSECRRRLGGLRHEQRRERLGAVYCHLTSLTLGGNGCLLFAGEQFYLVESCLGVSHHIFGSVLHSICHRAQRLFAVQGIAALHTDVILSVTQIDDTRHVVVNLTLWQLYRRTAFAFQFKILLHGITLESERHHRLDTQVTAEVIEGIDTIADG